MPPPCRTATTVISARRSPGCVSTSCCFWIVLILALMKQRLLLLSPCLLVCMVSPSTTIATAGIMCGFCTLVAVLFFRAQVAASSGSPLMALGGSPLVAFTPRLLWSPGVHDDHKVTKDQGKRSQKAGNKLLSRHKQDSASLHLNLTCIIRSATGRLERLFATTLTTLRCVANCSKLPAKLCCTEQRPQCLSPASPALKTGQLLLASCSPAFVSAGAEFPSLSLPTVDKRPR